MRVQVMQAVLAIDMNYVLLSYQTVIMEAVEDAQLAIITAIITEIMPSSMKMLHC